jgi:hypothetical protein
MYGLEKSVSLEFLQDLELTQVAVGEFQTILRFEKNTSITIEGISEISTKGGKISRIVRTRKSDVTKEFAVLLGSKVVKAANLGEGTLRLHFSNGAGITLFDSNKEFESYQISSAGREDIIV